ncbi:helix-turn-helix domain-containing protein [Brevundimonas faecalis]|uniref:helix-turn-helix domain-containing protein n=1 Tax=Brevundimonas faecalis TaxID=947378 RepID=UPI00361E6F41
MASYGRDNRIERHRHDYAYAALVVSGGYLEAGDAGRFHVEPGHIVIHEAHEAHQDRFHPIGARVLNLPLAESAIVAGLYRASEPDLLIRTAERDLHAASQLLQAELIPETGMLNDWPDQLAEALKQDMVFSLSDWAETMGLAPQSVSRGFRIAYGVSPKAFRAEHRALRAVRMLSTSATSMAELAADLGFADQAHMTRLVRRLSGRTPGSLRVHSVQEAGSEER